MQIRGIAAIVTGGASGLGAAAERLAAAAAKVTILDRKRDGKALPLREFARTISINLISSFNMLSKFAGRLHAAEAVGRERDVIIDTASVAAFDGQIAQAAYSASTDGTIATR